jgi:hypothetical protein
VIFPHIPKSGGTSLRTQFERSSLVTYYDYEFPPHHSTFFSKECERRNNESSLLDFSRFDLVFGHFPVRRYLGSQYKLAIILRHPLDLAVSQFFYWKNMVPKENRSILVRNPTVELVRSGELGFLEFLKVQSLNTFYQRYLNGVNPVDFSVVGFTDKYEQFTRDLSSLLGVRLVPDVHE